MGCSESGYLLPGAISTAAAEVQPLNNKNVNEVEMESDNFVKGIEKATLVSFIHIVIHCKAIYIIIIIKKIWTPWYSDILCDIV